MAFPPPEIHRRLVEVQNLFDIVHECADLLVVNKPAGLVCHPTKGDVYSSLISRARLYLGEDSKPELINRLDRETSGIVLIAKNAATALELRRIWESREVLKSYLAIVHGHVVLDAQTIHAPLGKDERSEVAIKDCVRDDGAAAETRFSVLRHLTQGEGKFSLLRVKPHTGRKHQIRIHLQSIGHPVVGDKLYGGDENIYLSFVRCQLSAEDKRRLLLENQALHAERVEFVWRGEARYFSAKPEQSFLDFAELSEWPIDGRDRSPLSQPADSAAALEP